MAELIAREPSSTATIQERGLLRLRKGRASFIIGFWALSGLLDNAGKLRGR
jgi:hypothetical protein